MRPLGVSPELDLVRQTTSVLGDRVKYLGTVERKSQKWSAHSGVADGHIGLHHQWHCRTERQEDEPEVRHAAIPLKREAAAIQIEVGEPAPSQICHSFN